MEYIKGVSSLYVRKFKRKLEQYNVPSSLPDYFAPMIGDKKEVGIAELGAGPVNTIGNFWKDVKVSIYASDVLQSEYEQLRKEHNAQLLVPIQYEDMESLSYPDEMFDIVHCRNAVDHTPNPYKAIEEMRRVCKKGGWIYLAHAPSQKTRFAGKHSCDFEMLSLPGFESRTEDGMIISICQKI